MFILKNKLKKIVVIVLMCATWVNYTTKIRKTH